MATNMKKTTTATTKKVVDETKRVFEPTDLIPCRSVTFGELLMASPVPSRKNVVYSWANYDDIQEVEYQDLVYDLRMQGRSFVKYPRFIIMDDDFIEQNPSLNDIYNSLYTNEELLDILQRSPEEIKKIVSNLPVGVKKSVKSLVSTLIQSGSFDSVNKIKALDEVLDTQMFQTLLGA